MDNQNIKGNKTDEQQKNVNQQQRPQDLESQGEQKGAQQVPSSQDTTKQ